ncbi:MAG: hypothetical protein IJB00_07215 [Akkermansia sp.]|nr:hypothetical protein [Akkermansia sp.]
MNARYQILVILSAMVTTAVAILLFGEKTVGYSSLAVSSVWGGLGTFCCLRMPGKPYWVQVLLCWGATLCLSLSVLHAASDSNPPHPYMEWFPVYMLMLILPPLLLLEALVIRLVLCLSKSAEEADSLHRHFMAAVEAGNIERVKALLPGIFINDTNERHETALQLAVLSATDTIFPRQGDALPIVRLLLQHGADAKGCLNAIVERHELNFEATDRNSPAYSTAVDHAVELIPLLSAAGDTISAEALSSARYNCDPAIQQALRQVKQTPIELPEE